MKAKEIWVIVPFSRPQYLENLKSNFLRQKFYNKKLIIVENGKGIGTCKRFGFKPDILLTSKPHQSDAKNKGIEALQDINAEFWTTFDDDDWYGPDYLQELYENSDKADIIGKSSIFNKTTEGKLRLFSGLENASTFDLHGPTISGWTKSTIFFLNTGRWGEDMQFLYRLNDKGATFWSTSKYNFIYQRFKSHDHAWTVTDYQLSQCWYKFQSKNNPSVIEYDVDKETMYNIVSQKIPLPDGNVIKYDPWMNEHSPSYVLAQRESNGFNEWVDKQVKKMEKII